MDPVPDERECWEMLRHGGQAKAQQWLFFRYVPWARAVAKDVYRRVRVPQMEWNDYAQNATVGLLEAMKRFDPSRGIDFVSYARPRVRGAVFNGLRSFLAQPQSHPDAVRWQERTSSFDDSDPDDRLGQMVSTVAGLGLGFLLEADAWTDPPGVHPDASTSAEGQEMDALLALAVAALPEREKLVVSLHYFQHLPFIEIASLMQLTKGRISQIHKSALLRIRTKLRETPGLRMTA